MELSSSLEANSHVLFMETKVHYRVRKNSQRIKQKVKGKVVPVLN
jgi:hypothetical protein